MASGGPSWRPWRGHGHSEWARQGYWFHEFLADLAALVDTLFPDRAIPIVGHSMGGNIASVFAGLRSQRLTHLVSLDGFGPTVDSVPADLKDILWKYLQMARPVRQHVAYETVAEVADRLMRANIRLTAERAAFLAEAATRKDEDGKRRWLFDPSHRKSLPSLHTMNEWGSIWSAIEVPTYWISSEDKRPNAPTNSAHEMEARMKMIPGLRHLKIKGTGHNLHHDAPEEVAKEIEEFLARTKKPAQ